MTLTPTPGSPAHAGIAPHDVGQAPVPCGLPRARGDRPREPRPPRAEARAPPRTRGSPACRPRSGCPASGSPAHAGIAPRATRSPPRSLGLPRARGDRPRRWFRSRLPVRAPPRTRGSPQLVLRRGPRVGGSPAHAGIAPGHGGRATSLPWLPRARGDRPQGQARGAGREAAPPRTRGSPLEKADLGILAEGSPAHAGIAPSPSSRAGARSRLPRARGDRPARTSATWFALVAPPRTRGSPLRGRLADEYAKGLPRARGDRPSPRRGWWFGPRAPPRTRGSPLRGVRPRGAARGSPAHAGIAPARWSRWWRRSGLPRARGDRPLTPGRRSSRQEAPPRTRGSPLDLAGGAVQRSGSPAHAGIAPSSRSPSAATSRLPRARGDRPAFEVVALQVQMAPPRTRGSPLGQPERRRAREGSPAHAGIAPSPARRP